MMLAHMRLRQLCLALRARCAELEARVEALESQEMHAAADNFDLAALEELMSTDWMMQGGGSGSGDGLPNLSRVAACPTLRRARVAACPNHLMFDCSVRGCVGRTRSHVASS